MSDRNNRNDGLQDYLELLEAYSQKSKNGYEILREQEDRKINKRNTFDRSSDTVNDEYQGSSYKRNRSSDESDIYSSSDFFEDSEPIVELEPFEPDDVYTYEEDTAYEDDSSYYISDDSAEYNINTSHIPAKKEKNPFKRLSNWFNNLPKNKKIIVSAIAIFLAMVITFTSVIAVFVYSKVDKMVYGDEIDQELDQIYQDPVFDEIEVDIGSSDFKQALIDWATTNNDKHMSSKNVLNVLLIGADSRNGTNTGNTDVMMLLSLNRKTKKITIASFLRDSYLYVKGDSHDYCTKLNAAFSMGGPDCLIQTIENNYKIEIDNYVMVNFKTFEKIIDEMGGVDVPKIEQFESDYNVKKHGIPLPVGENVTLDGAEALCFVRNRSCYGEGDIRRSQNQRIVIDSIMNKVKSASVSDLNRYIDILMPQVMTGFKKSEIISIGSKAIMGGWAGYERTQLQVPSDDNCQQGSAGMWIWVVDYQQAAHDLQMTLYGQSNIVIPENRTSLLDIYNGANYDSSSDDDDDVDVGENTADDDDSSYEEEEYVETEAQDNSDETQSNDSSADNSSDSDSSDDGGESDSSDDGGESDSSDTGGDDSSGSDSSDGGAGNLEPVEGE